MSKQAIMKQLNKIFQDIFDDEDIIVNDTTTADDIEDWDSLEQINLIVAMEQRFQIKFDLSEVGQLKNVGEMADLIAKKVNI